MQLVVRHSVLFYTLYGSHWGQKSFTASSEVLFDVLSEDEILYYVDRYLPMDKAGAYGVQEWIGYIGVKSISGSFYNIMGLPIQKLYGELKKL